jgi:hypothetical protein
MIGVIPNPKKSITISVPFNRVKFAVDNLKSTVRFLHLRERNQIFNSYTFARNEFLSIGVFIDINLNDAGGGQTQINIEVRRKMGAFDESYEVQKASQHIQDIFNGISVILTNGVPQPKPQQQVKPPKGNDVATRFLILLLLFTFTCMGVIYINKYNQKQIDKINQNFQTK